MSEGRVRRLPDGGYVVASAAPAEDEPLDESIVDEIAAELEKEFGKPASGKPAAEDLVARMFGESGGGQPERPTPEAKAREIWAAMDENQRTGVRFGMFPADVMRAAEKEGYKTRDLSVALMAIASEKPKSGAQIESEKLNAAAGKTPKAEAPALTDIERAVLREAGSGTTGESIVAESGFRSGRRSERGRQQRPPRQPEKPESSQRNPWASGWTPGVRCAAPQPLVSNTVEVGNCKKLLESGGYGEPVQRLHRQGFRGLELKQEGGGSPAQIRLRLTALTELCFGPRICVHDELRRIGGRQTPDPMFRSCSRMHARRTEGTAIEQISVMRQRDRKRSG